MALAGSVGLALSGGGSCSRWSTSSLLAWGVGRLPVRLSFLVVGLSCAGADGDMNQSLSWIRCCLLLLLLPCCLRLETGNSFPLFSPLARLRALLLWDGGRARAPGRLSLFPVSCLLTRARAWWRWAPLCVLRRHCARRQDESLLFERAWAAAPSVSGGRQLFFCGFFDRFRLPLPRAVLSFYVALFGACVLGRLCASCGLSLVVFVSRSWSSLLVVERFTLDNNMCAGGSTDYYVSL